jgi:hypothetical protein
VQTSKQAGRQAGRKQVNGYPRKDACCHWLSLQWVKWQLSVEYATNPAVHGHRDLVHFVPPLICCSTYCLAAGPSGANLAP